jgi:hypothetical protein
MGKPRRFSQAFLQGERAKLHDYRANIRELRNGKVPAGFSSRALVVLVLLWPL